jgi:hypothetical protein
MPCRPLRLVLTTGLSFSLLAACARYENQTGVDNTWRRIDIANFEVGATTRAQIMDALGPPSQLIDLSNGTVLYYLNQHETAGGYVLVLFNSLRQETTFDRAIFFFDEAGVLTEYALSDEINPSEPG